MNPDSSLPTLADELVERAAEQAGGEGPPVEDSCRPVRVVVDGQEETIRVHAAEPMGEEVRAAFGEIVAAARRHVVAANAHLGVVQELLAAARIAAWCIPDGTVHSRFGVHNGAEVKARLRTAVKGAQAALTPPKAGEGDPEEGGRRG